MGILKKVFGENGVFARLAGANQRGSHQLVCQQLAARHQQDHYITTATTPNRHPNLAQFQLTSTQLAGQQHQSNKSVLFHNQEHHHLNTMQQASKRSRRRAARKQHEVACLSSLEAEMLASLSQMPALKFHPVHGPNAQLSDNMMSARRTQSFCEAIVFSDRLIMPNERIYIRVLDIAKGWNGTIRFGFTSCDPDKFRFEPMPKHACPDMTQAGHTWAHALADKLVKRDTIIHFSYSPSGFIQYGINNQECGMFVAKVKTSEPLWFVIDIYGLTTAIELIDPRLAQSSNDENVLFAGQQHVRSGLMPAGTFPSPQQQTRYERRAAKLAAAAYQQQQQKLPQTARAASRTTTSTTTMPHLYRQPRHSDLDSHYATHRIPDQIIATGEPNEALPNLSSIMLPMSRQNIYTSLPMAVPAQPMHEQQQHYYQLHSTSSVYGNTTQMSQSSSTSSSALNNISCDSIENPASTEYPTRRNPNDDAVMNPDESNSSQDSVSESQQRQQSSHSLSASANNSSPSHNTSTSSKKATTTTTTGLSAPIAATRRTQNRHQSTAAKLDTPSGNSSKQNVPVLTSRNSNQTINNNNSRARSARSSTGGKQSNANNINNSTVSSKNTNNNNSILARDKNNNSPITRDCPICFERPINCVLYQCGHMCTCYECGVKQWRTQSRTCPICRTVIKDVIKTYLS